jgi:hypothetical protein
LGAVLFDDGPGLTNNKEEKRWARSLPEGACLIRTFVRPPLDANLVGISGMQEPRKVIVIIATDNSRPEQTTQQDSLHSTGAGNASLQGLGYR